MIGFMYLFINLLFLLAVWWLLPNSIVTFSIVCVGLVILLMFTIKRSNQAQTQIRERLEAGFRSLHDGDFSISLPYTQNKHDNNLIDLFNHMTDKLRVEKQYLYHRELLLDKVVNASNVITVLTNQRQQIIFANLSASEFFNSNSLIGAHWTELLSEKSPALSEHIHKNNAIIQLEDDKNLSNSSFQSWHLSKHHLKLHGASHELILLKPITQELNAQELQTWKKVVRVINHELNNSIAPISSMCHSGQILAEQLQQPQLDRVFNTISNRIQKLSEFIQNYSQLARLSSPQKQQFDLKQTIEQVAVLYNVDTKFDVTHWNEEEQNALYIFADASQIEQLLINLLKNANQAQPDKNCQLTVSSQRQGITITVRDFGSGMTQDVMQKAFLPYFSTKQDGSGIGLSICKEVVDAHQGNIQLNNHPQGGLEITVELPIKI